MTHPAKERGSAPGASPAESKRPASTLTAVTASHDTGQSGGTGWHLVIRDEVLFDPTIPTSTKLILGAYASPRNPPTMADVLRAMPFLHERDHAAAMKDIRRSRLATVTRRNKIGKPNLLTNLAPNANTWTTGTRSVRIPVELLQQLPTGRSVEEAVILLGLYTREQLRRGAIQLSDDVAAWQLHWTPKKVAAWRGVLLGATIIRQVQRRRSRRAAIHVIDGGCPPPDLERFEEARTRDLTPVAVTDDLTLRVYARPEELAVVDVRLGAAEPSDIDAVRDYAATLRCENPDRPYCFASDLLDGPLWGVGMHEAVAVARAVAWHTASSTNEPDDSDIPY